jgi:hypothetical protein
VKFKVGDKVFLNPESDWVDGLPTNPINTIGTVVPNGVFNLDLYVEWSNGETNFYYHEDLIPASKLGKYLYGATDEV